MMHNVTAPVRRIQQLVCNRRGVTIDDMLSRRRQAHLSVSRHIAVWLARQTTQQSLPKIGLQFGPRDHTTILHSVQKVDAMMMESTDFGLEMVQLLMEVELG